MRITPNGVVHEIELEQSRTRFDRHLPVATQTHWIEMDGHRSRRWE